MKFNRTDMRSSPARYRSQDGLSQGLDWSLAWQKLTLLTGDDARTGLGKEPRGSGLGMNWEVQ